MCRHTLSGHWWHAFPSPGRHKVLACHQVLQCCPSSCSGHLCGSSIPSWSSCTQLGPVLRSFFFPPMMKTISRGHAAGLETPPGPSRVQDTPPQHNPFPCLLPPLRCAAQKESLLTTCTVVLWNFRGRGRTPLSACWGRLDCREPFSPISRTLVQFGHSSPQHKHF